MHKSYWLIHPVTKHKLWFFFCLLLYLSLFNVIVLLCYQPWSTAKQQLSVSLGSKKSIDKNHHIGLAFSPSLKWNFPLNPIFVNLHFFQSVLSTMVKHPKPKIPTPMSVLDMFKTCPPVMILLQQVTNMYYSVICLCACGRHVNPMCIVVSPSWHLSSNIVEHLLMEFWYHSMQASLYAQGHKVTNDVITHILFWVM